MKVRWSSTYAMLDRAYNVKADVDKFGLEIAMDEVVEKRQELAALQILGMHILSLRIARALEKVDQYYQKASNSNAYTFAIALNPTKELSYFQKHWPDILRREAEAQMEETFKQRYLQLHDSPTAVSVPIKKPATCKMRRSVSLDDNDTDMPGLAELHLDPFEPWLDKFNLYLTTREVVPDGMDTIKWWGRDLNFRKSSLVDDGGTDDLDYSQKQSEGRKKGWDSILTEESDNHDPDYDIDF
ncbi:hypothetical protein B0H19DRAFT_1250923 [Mycena capillaripes]|nr:hypothetical protein B0H19DRAFT_1250923 [Mycena capillaripes]